MMTNPASRSRPYSESFALYVKAGWQGVIPVVRKHPPQTGYTGTQGLWPSFADMQTWADNDEGERNIGLRVAASVLGIDVDDYGSKHGGQTLNECIARWGELPRTWRSTSRDDGVSGIRFYRIPLDLAWPGQLPGGSVELVRWDHRYAVVWPSLHPETERIYRWISPDEITVIGTVPSVDELPALPSSWVDGLSRGAYEHESKIGALDLDELGGGGSWLMQLNRANERPCRPVRAAMARLVSSLAGSSSRHDMMTAGVLDLVRRGEQGHPGVIAALRTVGESFVVAVTADGSRSSTTAWGEIMRAIDGAVRLVANGPRTPSLGDPCIIPSDPPFDPDSMSTLSGSTGSGSLPFRPEGPTPDVAEPVSVTPVPPAVQELPADVVTRMRQILVDREARRQVDQLEHPLVELPPDMTLTQMLAVPLPTALYRIDQLMPIGSRVLLAAQMKSGKTTLVANLLRSLLDGEPFLGFAVTPTDGRVVLLDNEMDANMLRRWLGELGIVHQDRASVVTMRGRVNGFDLRDERLLTLWVERLRALSCSVLIVDCLKPILDQLALDESRETGRITTPLTRLMIEAGISELILVHHMGHNGERSRGDSALRGWPEVEWHLVRMAEDPDKEAEMDAPRYFKAYGRDVDIPERRLEYDARTRRLSIGGNSTRKADQAAAKESEIESTVLAIIAESPGVAKGKIPSLMRERGVRGKDTRFWAVVELLIARDTIRVQFGGRGDREHQLYLRVAHP